MNNLNIEKIAQYIINNRYNKNISNTEMYNNY